MKLTKRTPVEVTCPTFSDGFGTFINYKLLIKLQSEVSKFNNEVPKQKTKKSDKNRRR